MNELIKKYPQFEAQIKSVFSFQASLKTFRTISTPGKPTGNIKTDVGIIFSHFLSILHLRITSQIDYLLHGLQSESPEAFSTARNCLETIAALIYVQDKVGKKVDEGEYEEAKNILYKASMGSRTEHPTFANSQEVTDMAKKAYNVLDYVDRANELIAKDLKNTGDEDGAKQNYFRSQYNLLSELTHPNYLALSMFWNVEDEKFTYNLPQSILEEQHFGLLVHTISPMLPIYLLYYKRALALEKKLND